jgi:hypothetical protein
VGFGGRGGEDEVDECGRRTPPATTMHASSACLIRVSACANRSSSS